MIEFFFDCSSPWTWLAFRNIQPLAAELGVPVAYKPVLVGGIFNAVNPSVYEFRERGVPAKQAYHRKDLADWARHCGVEILFPPSVFPVNSVKAMRGCLWLDRLKERRAAPEFLDPRGGRSGLQPGPGGAQPRDLASSRSSLPVQRLKRLTSRSNWSSALLTDWSMMSSSVLGRW